MLQTTGPLGLVGAILAIFGIAVVALQSPLIAGGLALVLGGVSLLVYGMTTTFLEAMGMAPEMSIR